MPFDYTRAISLNQAALRLVVAEIFALLEIVLDGTAKNLPLALQQVAYRLLVPAEAALRRLIVIAARGVKFALPPVRALPKNARFAAKGQGPLCFQLFDTRKRFFRKPSVTSPLPRIHFFDGPTLTTISVPKLKTRLTSHRIIRRFEAFKLALENIPHHAKRLRLWQARRALKKQVKFRDPLRPGLPPGYRRKPALAIDHILKECHALAFDALREAPS